MHIFGARVDMKFYPMVYEVKHVANQDHRVCHLQSSYYVVERVICPFPHLIGNFEGI